MVPLIDVHTHLTDAEFDPVQPEIMAYLASTDQISICVSMDTDNSLKTIELARQFPNKVIPFVGIHPWNSTEKDELERFLDAFTSLETPNVGIGEIGLDKKYVKTPEEYKTQQRVFEKMLELAENFQKPISVHSRGSHDDAISSLSSYSLRSVNLHWFSGSTEQLERAVERGYFVSYGPTLVYSKKTRELAKNTPPDLILTGTDGPVRHGACFEERIALPAFLASVVFALGSVMKLDYATVANLVADNSTRYMKV